MTSGSSETAAGDAPAVGRTEFGLVSIEDRVVQKIASRAATEVPEAGSAARRLLGRSLPGLAAAGPGRRPTGLGSLPTVNADVEGSVAVVDLHISVRWPASVPAVTQAVRDRVRDRLSSLTGLTVTEINIVVDDLVSSLPAARRVQ